MQLGGKCVLCSNTINLEFDCRRPRGHGHHLLGSLDRIRFYELEAATGNLQLLCSTCHQKKTKADRVGKKLSWYYEI
jgi:5-methylcytosine-specific restriction endonuclease McrA